MSTRLRSPRLIRCAASLLVFWTMVLAAPPAGSTPASPSVATPPGKLVFASNRDGDFEIYKVNADGSDLTRLTDNENHRDADPQWSPDGTKILFIRKTTSIQLDSIGSESTDLESVQKLYVMNADGSDQRRLTGDTSGNEPTIESQASFSPDGSKVLFTRSTSAPFSPYQMHIINADGSDERGIGPRDLNYDVEPMWSPDGRTILFSDAAKVCTMNADGSDYASGERIHQLTDSREAAAYARFSPDGTSIAFAGDREGDFEIFVMTQDGADHRALTQNEAGDVDPAWSPDGSAILFSRASTGSDSISNDSDLWLMDLESSTEHVVAEEISSYDEELFLGNNWIAVQRRISEDEHDIEVVAIDGSSSYVLADSPVHDWFGSWHSDRISTDAPSGATESSRSRAWPLAAMGVLGAAGVCTGAWYWSRRKRSRTASP